MLVVNQHAPPDMNRQDVHLVHGIHCTVHMEKGSKDSSEIPPVIPQLKGEIHVHYYNMQQYKAGVNYKIHNTCIL